VRENDHRWTSADVSQCHIILAEMIDNHLSRQDRDERTQGILTKPGVRACVRACVRFVFSQAEGDGAGSSAPLRGLTVGDRQAESGQGDRNDPLGPADGTTHCVVRLGPGWRTQVHRCVPAALLSCGPSAGI
jgi:hypothetical protein